MQRPWDYMVEIMEEKNIPTHSVKIKLGLKRWQLKLLQGGLKRIDEDMALKLAQLFETNSALWINLDRAYAESIGTSPTNISGSTEAHGLY